MSKLRERFDALITLIDSNNLVCRSFAKALVTFPEVCYSSQACSDDWSGSLLFGSLTALVPFERLVLLSQMLRPFQAVRCSFSDSRSLVKRFAALSQIMMT